MMPSRTAVGEGGKAVRFARRGLGLMLAALSLAPAAAAESGLRLELNRLEPQGEACRAYLLLENKTTDVYKSLKLDLFVLDVQGIVAKRLAVEVGPVTSKKTLIKTFDFPALACDKVGTVLLNDVMTCDAGEGGAREGCVDLIETGSRATVPLMK